MQVVVVTVPPKTKYAEKARLMDDAVASEGANESVLMLRSR